VAPPRRNPVKDAKAVKEILARRYFIDEFIELYDSDATAVGIRRLFGDLVVLVADSCFSGDLLNVNRGAEPVLDSDYFRNALKYNARRQLCAVPAGVPPVVEARSGFDAAKIELTLKPRELKEVSLKLERMKGNLFI
jgi:hypothetical protein